MAADPSAPHRPIAFIDLATQTERLRPLIETAIARVLDHGGFIMGPEVAELERALEKASGARHCITCANGTDALMLVLMSEGIGPGDAVLVPSFTFMATAEAVAEQRATPIFVDVLPASFNLDPESLARGIAEARGRGLRPRMVIPVDLFGQPADYDAIRPIAEREGLLVCADAAQSFGALYRGRAVGTHGTYTTTSFFPAKPLGCYGDGGAILTDDPVRAERLASLRVHGKGKDKYDNIRIGLNSRLDTMQAAVLLAKLGVFQAEIEAREIIAGRYEAGLAEHVATPRLIEGATSVWAQYTILLPEWLDRAGFQRRCAIAGVPTMVYYPTPLHRQTGYLAFPREPGGCPVSEELSRRVVSLPMHAYLGPEQQDHVISTVIGALQA